MSLAPTDLHAATSLRFDRDTKVSLYAAHGIPEMWLVDEPDLGTPLEVSALPGVAVELHQLFGS